MVYNCSHSFCAYNSLKLWVEYIFAISEMVFYVIITLNFWIIWMNVSMVSDHITHLIGTNTDVLKRPNYIIHGFGLMPLSHISASHWRIPDEIVFCQHAKGHNKLWRIGWEFPSYASLCGHFASVYTNVLICDCSIKYILY